MKMVYIFKNEIFEEKNIGVIKKINMQIDAFRKYGYDPVLFMYDNRRVYICDKVNGKSNIKYFDSLKKSLEFILDSIQEIKPEFIYARHTILYTHYIFDFYKELCNCNKVIYEFYTYPYDDEFKKGDIGIEFDRYYRSKLREFLKITTNFNNLTEILGIKSIPINNGIDLNTIKVKEDKLITYKNLIELTGIATLWFWHGYDRIIEGLNRYYNYNKNKVKQRIVKFNIVGEGNESERLKRLVEQYKLGQYVNFYGRVLDKNLLHKLRQKTDIGIGSLALHRLNMYDASPLKAVEYCAAGIPFIVSYDENAFKDKPDFILKIEATDKPVDINDIIDFYDRTCSYDTTLKMRDYAEKNLTWKSIMGKVLKEAGLL